MASGNGTLFETLVTRCRAGELDAEPVLLISSSPEAPVLQRARRLDVPSVVLERKTFAAGEEFTKTMLNCLRERNADLVCLAGYLKLIPSAVVQAFQHRMLNIHPALLPAFGGKGMYGMRVHEAVIEYGVRISGATVHLVDDEYDHGPVILQRAVFVRQDDTPDSLSQRVHEIEHDLYVDAVRLFADDRVAVQGRRVTILPKRST
ncbi:phosphoribosylglycinamide formyltransferase [bacterium]|nr:phosphoribosylglycinamide formyltransferase [bacterium]MBU1983214.1 phosphoribosylglycinamide formyltransferase [bacterium]